MTEQELREIRERAHNATSGPWHRDKMCNVWSQERPIIGGETVMVSDIRFIAHCREDVPALCDEVDRLRAEIRRRELNEYRWQCSGCGHFQKHHSSRYRCDKCQRANYLSGSFRREDLEAWFDARQALGEESNK